jgi:7-cyano-7-deazaguanine reductase
LNSPGHNDPVLNNQEFSMSVTDVSGLSQLGTKVDTPESPEKAVLEKVPNGNAGTDYVVRFTAPEFTSLCPMTGQPDFAHIVIDYIPGDFLVESKSLKLFLQSFRNHGAFHEDCSVYIAKRLVELLQPKWLRIGAYWYPRGGIPIDVFWQTGAAPEGVWLPDQGVAPYRGRG